MGVCKNEIRFLCVVDGLFRRVCTRVFAIFGKAYMPPGFRKSRAGARAAYRSLRINDDSVRTALYYMCCNNNNILYAEERPLRAFCGQLRKINIEIYSFALGAA